MSDYIPTIGLEIHAELKTRTKMFCDSKNDPDETRPNANVCPVCLGHPGTLPVINKEALQHVLRVGVALGGTVADRSSFDRKNYFYPDIPKGYQISQYQFPLVSGGSLHGVAITRVHLEEDTGTSLHDKGNYSLLDFNRAGVPLMELVTEPAIHSAKEAADFARELQLLLRYLGASDANMEKGEMRVEANISVARSNKKRMVPNESRIVLQKESYNLMGHLFRVHNALGSSYKEKNYQDAIEAVFKNEHIAYEREKEVPVMFGEQKVSSIFADFVVAGDILLEIKATKSITQEDIRQVLRYIKSLPVPLGIIVNFRKEKLETKRIINPAFGNHSKSFDIHSSGSPLGTKVEVKNLNSFKAVERAIEYEVQRQAAVLDEGGEVVQETRGWDEQNEQTFSQRRKEESHDYRYFPEPDLPRMSLSEISGFSADAIRKSLPELPAAKRERYLEEGIRQEYADMFVADERLGKLFEETAAEIFKNYDNNTVVKTLAANYIGSDIAGLVSRCGTSGLAHITAEGLAAVMSRVMLNEISSRGAKDAIAEVFQQGGDLSLVSKKYLQAISAGELEEVVRDVILKNANAVADYKNGKGAALQFLVGQGMKATKGTANPEKLRELIRKAIG